MALMGVSQSTEVHVGCKRMMGVPIKIPYNHRPEVYVLENHIEKHIEHDMEAGSV